MSGQSKISQVVIAAFACESISGHAWIIGGLSETSSSLTAGLTGGEGVDAEELEGIRRAYHEAREALEIGTALATPGAVYKCLHDARRKVRLLTEQPWTSA